MSFCDENQKDVSKIMSAQLKIIITAPYVNYNLILVRYLRSLLKHNEVVVIWQKPETSVAYRTPSLLKVINLLRSPFIARGELSHSLESTLKFLLKGKIPRFSFHFFRDHFSEDPNSYETVHFLRKKKPDIILVLGGKLLNKQWIGAARFGAIGFHPGILPNYRGACPVEFALYYNDLDNIGGTVFRLNEGIDAGAILRRFYVNPRRHKNIQSLGSCIYKVGIETISEIVGREIEAGEVNRGGRLFFRRELTSEVNQAIHHRFVEMSCEKPEQIKSIENIECKKYDIT